MTQAQIDKTLAVICLHCKQPIAIPPAVAERQQSDTVNLRDRKCQVFHLRCGNCGKEKPYRVSEILEVDESSAQAANWSWQQPLTRSAAGR